jgi:hypothetical protein
LYLYFDSVPLANIIQSRQQFQRIAKSRTEITEPVAFTGASCFQDGYHRFALRFDLFGLVWLTDLKVSFRPFAMRSFSAQ